MSWDGKSHLNRAGYGHHLKSFNLALPWRQKWEVCHRIYSLLGMSPEIPTSTAARAADTMRAIIRPCQLPPVRCDTKRMKQGAQGCYLSKYGLFLWVFSEVTWGHVEFTTTCTSRQTRTRRLSERKKPTRWHFYEPTLALLKARKGGII